MQTNGFSVEYGRTAGGVLTLATESGTNEIRGAAFWYTPAILNLGIWGFPECLRKVSKAVWHSTFPSGICELGCMPHVLDSLLSAFRETAAGRPDRRDGRSNKRYEVSDAAGCAPACFFTRCESFLAFQRRMERDGSRSNCRTLFGVGRIPCDNRIRNLLDDRDPAAFDPPFRSCLATVAAQGALEPFQRLDERLPAAPDGVRFHRSDRVHCPRCSVRRGGSERRPHHFHAMAVGHRGGRRPRHRPAADA